MTNEPTVLPYLNEALKINDALLGLPALPMVLIGCIVCGYMCKLIPRVQNRWIPGVVFAVGIGLNICMVIPCSLADGARAVILGMVAGGASILIHRKLLKNWIDVNVFETGETKFIQKKENNEKDN